MPQSFIVFRLFVFFSKTLFKKQNQENATKRQNSNKEGIEKTRGAITLIKSCHITYIADAWGSKAPCVGFP